MQVCKDVQEWIEEEVEQEIEKQEERCKNWPWPLSWVCSVVTFIVKVIVRVGKWVTRTICEVVTVAVCIAAMLVNALLAIPVIGAIIRAFIRLGAWAASLFLGLFDGAGRAAGVRTIKKLRVRIVSLTQDGQALVQPEELTECIEATRQVLRDGAGIDARISVELPIADTPGFALDIGFWDGQPWTAISTALEELGLTGSWFQLQTLNYLDSAFTNLIGFGNPIVVYVVREVGDDSTATGTKAGIAGISLGPAADWLAVEAAAVRKPVEGQPPPLYYKYSIAHEIVHALGYYGHDSEPGNLMYPEARDGTYLTPFEVGLIRSSPKVTYI